MRQSDLYVRIAARSTPRPDGCWQWTGADRPSGYPRTRHRGERVLVSRALLAQHLGRALSADELACHTCDRPWCVNPVHLFVGLASDNSSDMVQKDRSAFGVRHPRAKLDDDRVLAIRRSAAGGASLHRLAKAHGVSKRAVQFAVQGHTWRRAATPTRAHVDPALLPQPARGERCGNAKLTAAAVMNMRMCLALGARQVDCAAWFDVTQSTVSSIKLGQTWA